MAKQLGGMDEEDLRAGLDAIVEAYRRPQVLILFPISATALGFADEAEARAYYGMQKTPLP